MLCMSYEQQLQRPKPTAADSLLALLLVCDAVYRPLSMPTEVRVFAAVVMLASTRDSPPSPNRCSWSSDHSSCDHHVIGSSSCSHTWTCSATRCRRQHPWPFLAAVIKSVKHQPCFHHRGRGSDVFAGMHFPSTTGVGTLLRACGSLVLVGAVSFLVFSFYLLLHAFFVIFDSSYFAPLCVLSFTVKVPLYFWIVCCTDWLQQRSVYCGSMVFGVQLGWLTFLRVLVVSKMLSQREVVMEAGLVVYFWAGIIH